MIQARPLGLVAVVCAFVCAALFTTPPATAGARRDGRPPKAAAPMLGFVQQPSADDAILDPSGVRLSFVVGDVRDPIGSQRGQYPPEGRWVLLSIAVTNVGARPFALSPIDFQILTGDAVIYPATSGTGVSTSELSPIMLEVGATARGDVVFDVPAGKTLQSALFQAPGTNQFVIAALTP